jgi:hypothetical protein
MRHVLKFNMLLFLAKQIVLILLRLSLTTKLSERQLRAQYPTAGINNQWVM